MYLPSPNPYDLKATSMQARLISFYTTATLIRLRTSIQKMYMRVLQIVYEEHPLTINFLIS